MSDPVYNRTEYLNGNYDKGSAIEEHAYAKALECSGLDWNMYIKDYILRNMREDLMKLDVSACSALLQYIPMLELGMFNTVAAALSAATYTDASLEALRVKWIPLLKSANDISAES